jgi:hypothetical protein
MIQTGHPGAADGACWCRAAAGYALPMTRPPPNFTELEYRLLASGCEALAEKERARAAELAGDPAVALGFVKGAETFEWLASRCMRMTEPE